MKKSKIALLVIDAQFDFCDPAGSLFVQGADADMVRLGAFIKKNKSDIDYIGMTMDSHQVLDISHPGFWQDKDGNHPGVFTIITHSDVLSGKWSPRFAPIEATNYLENLEKQGEFPHCIWPEHCIIGSKGSSFVSSVMDAVIEWSRSNGAFHQVVAKGTYPTTEHFGAFRANIPVEGRPETQLNLGLIKTLEKFDTVYFVGEAKSHCVANTMKQALMFPDLAKKFVVLEDCMSNVTGFEHIADQIYSDAKAAGVQFTVSTSI